MMKNNSMMIVRTITIIYLLVACAAAQAPDTVWTRTYGGIEADAGFALIQASDGNLLIAGPTLSFGENGNIYLVKVNQDGETVFERDYGGSNAESARSIAEASDGGYILLGYSEPSIYADYDIFMGKTDIDGNLVWTQTYVDPGSDEYGMSVLETAGQDIIVAGYITNYGPHDDNIVLMKTDASGDLIWRHEYGDSCEDIGQSVIETTDGGYVVTGWTTSYGSGSGDIFLMKTDSDGNLSWFRTYGYQDWEGGRCVIETSDGGFAVVGRTNSVGNGSWDVFLIKTDSAGNLEWWRNYGGEEWDSAYSVVEAKDRGFLLGGYTLSFDIGGFDFYLIKTDYHGNEIWYKAMGGYSVDYGHRAIYSFDGAIYFMGVTWSFGHGSEDIYLVKLEHDITDIPDCTVTNPGSFQLHQNYPNPFNAKTTVKYSLVAETYVTLDVFDLLGRKIETLISMIQSPGPHTITWDASHVASGMYFYRIQAGDYSAARIMNIIK